MLYLKHEVRHMKIEDLESVKFMTMRIREANEFPSMLYRKAKNLLLQISDEQLLRGPDKNRLERFVVDELETFDLRSQEKKFCKALEEILTGNLRRMRNELARGQEVNYRAQAEEMSAQLKRLKRIDFNLDENFNRLRRRILNRYNVDYDNLTYFLNRCKRKLENAIQEANFYTVDSLVQRTPEFFEEMENYIAAHKKSESAEPIEVVVYHDKDGNHYISNSDAIKLRMCSIISGEFFLLDDHQYSYLQKNAHIEDEQLEKEKTPQDEKRPVMMIYLGPNLLPYKEIQFVGSQVDCSKLAMSLSPIELANFIEYSDIVWVKIDDEGNLKSATPSDVEHITREYLHSIGEIEELSCTNEVHRYRIDYTARKEEALPTDILT